MRRWGLLLIALPFLLGPSPASASSHYPSSCPDLNDPVAADRVPGEYIITLSEGQDPQSLARLLESGHSVELHPFGRDRYLLRLTPDPGLPQLQQTATQAPQVRAIQPNFRYR